MKIIKIGLFVAFLISLGFVSFFHSFIPVAHAWFGAGSTPGWPHTTTGLRGEIALPIYKFSPDFYTVGDTVSIQTAGFNSSSEEITSHYWLVVSRVTQAPIGTDRTHGDPTNPGLNENQLYDFHQAGNDQQVHVATVDIGAITFPANGSTTFGASYTTTMPGYYQFDFIDIDPSDSYEPGHILTAGFFRVLEGSNPSTTVTPTGIPKPTEGTTVTTSSSSSNGASSNNSPSSSSSCSAQKPPAPSLSSVTRLNSSTVRLSWNSVNPATHYSISYGTNSGNYQFGVSNTGNTTSYSIGALNPNQNYYFAVRAVNDCAPGELSNERSTGGTGGSVLGTTTEGQVLGASTDILASTGSKNQYFRILIAGTTSVFLMLSLFKINSHNESV